MRIARVQDEQDCIVWAEETTDGKLMQLEGDPFAGTLKPTGEAVTVKHFLPPVEPRAVICIGLNYAKHAEEGGFPVPEYPVFFMKNPSAVTGHGQPIRIPAVCDDEVDYECELAVVIGKTCKNVPKEEALKVVLGYTAGNDVSARIWQMQKGGTQWCRAKSFDTFAPLGPVLVTPEEIGNPNDLSIRTLLNGLVMQDSHTSDQIFDVPTLISFLSQDTTLLSGTVILTGTPSGIGWARDPKTMLKKGDTVAVEIEKIGRLENPVA